MGRQDKHPRPYSKAVSGFSRARFIFLCFLLFAVLLLCIPATAFGQEGTEQGPNKDIWDILSALSGFVSGIVVAAIGGLFTYIYNERQRKAEDNRSSRELAVQRVQTVQTFLPHLASQNELEKRAALLAINYLGDAKLASELATLFRGEGAVSALAEIATSSSQEEATFARRSLGELFDRLRSSVVVVRAGGRASASGFVARADGLIMTVSLIVESTIQDFSVQFPDESSPRTAQLLKNVPNLGLTLLTVEGVEGKAFHPLPIDETLPAVDDEIFALNPPHEQEAWAPIVGRVVSITEQRDDLLLESALIEAHLQDYGPGFAGMPVVNRRGSVIGIGYAAGYAAENLPGKVQEARKSSYLIPVTNAAQVIASISSDNDTQQ